MFTPLVRSGSRGICLSLALCSSLSSCLVIRHNLHPSFTKSHGARHFGRMGNSRLRAAVGEEALQVPTLEPRLIAERPELVKSHLNRRGATDQQFAAVDRIAELTVQRNKIAKHRDEALAIRKQLSPQIGRMMKEQDVDGAEALKKQVQEASERAKDLDAELEEVEAEQNSLFSELPNLLDSRVPNGSDETENELVSEWAEGLTLMDGGLWHDELATTLGGLKLEAAARISGARFSVLQGQVAQLERALINFFLDVHTAEHGYTELSVPLLVSRTSLEGTGQLPKFEEDLFKLTTTLSGQESYLIPTAEVPVTNLHRGEILSEETLPISYVTVTPCFRAEAGSHGRDTRGLFRQHQFYKVELVKITTPEQSDAEHEMLTAHAETILQKLKLPYRKMRLCAGDIGFSARHCYDLEVWLPAQQTYREISSCSNTGDFQARRMGLRYKAKSGKTKAKLCHTINGSGLAVGRTLVAILENYQQEDGSIAIPEVLQPYMRGLTSITPQ